MRALILDDDEIFLAVAESYLAALGAADVQTTTDPVEASDIVHNDRIDLVMLDLNMPEQDGLSFLRSLSEVGFVGSVIIVSGEKSAIVSSSGYIGEKLGLDVCGALAKPLEMSELKRAFECSKVSAAQLRKSKPVVALVPTGELSPILHYQPQIDVRTGNLLGAEALLRGVDEQGVVFGPGQMLSKCQSTEKRFELTAQLCDIFCAGVADLRRNGFDNRFSLNVDAANLEFPEFVEMMMDSVRQHDVDPSGIVIELIESHLPENESWLLEVIARLSIAGFDVAMDDFSTGASSFELLRAGAFAEIKLDANLVQKSAEDAASAKFIANAVQIADALEMRIIAEGVESETDIVRMENMGIKCVQGYFIAKPADKKHLLNNYQHRRSEQRAAS